MLGRREFSKKVGTWLLLACTTTSALLTEGCNTLNDILAWIPVGLNAFDNIVTLLENVGIINPLAGSAVTALILTIQKGFADLKADIIAYQAITPPPVGALAKIDAILGLIVNNFQQFLNDVNIPDQGLLTLVVGFASLILSTIAGFIGQLPPATSAQLSTVKDRLARPVHVSGRLVSYTPQAHSVRSFKASWNRLAKAGGHAEMQLPVSLLEHL
jgi:hypothetical protein